MRAEISALHKRIGVTTAYVTHDQIEAMTMADRVVLMREGVIQQIADPDTLFREPDNLFVAGFIGSPGMNLVAATVEQKNQTPCIDMFGTPVPIDAQRLNGAKQVIAGLRPENIGLGDGPVSFNVRPSLIESLGSEKYVYFHDDIHQIARSDDGDEENSKGLIARVPYSGSLQQDEEITLSFDPGDLYLFDAQTERAI